MQVWLLVMNPLKFQNFWERYPANIVFSWIIFSWKQEQIAKIAEKEIEHFTLKNPKTENDVKITVP